MLTDKHKNIEYGAIPTSPRLDQRNRGDAIVSAYNLGTISNLLSTLISGSMFSLPWSFHIAGVYGGSVVVMIIAFISYETIRALLSAQREIYLKTGDVVGYPDLAANLLKSNQWSKAIQTATVISCIGGNIGYLIFIGGIASQLLDMPSLLTTIFAAIALIFLSFIRSFRDLSIFTTIGVIANLSSFVAVFVMGTTLDSSTYEIVYFRVYPTMIFVGSATFMFGIHYCIVSMGAEILTRYKEKHAEDVYHTPIPSRRVVSPLPALEYDLAIAFVISTIGVIALGISGSIFYSGGDYVRDDNGNILAGCEDVICQNVVLNLPPGKIRDFIGFSLIVAMLMTYTIFLIPAREHIERFVMRWTRPAEGLAETWTRNGVRTSLVITTAIVALCAPYFGGVLTTVGGITDAFQIYVVPALVYMKMQRNKGIRDKSTYFYHFVFIWGVCLMSFTVFNTVRSMV